MKTTKVAIVGFGTIGSGVARLLLEHGDRIARHAGQAAGIGARGRSGPEAVAQRRPAAGLLTNDLSKVLDNPGDRRRGASWSAAWSPTAPSC